MLQSNDSDGERAASAYPVWDVPTRIIHWSLPVLLAVAWWSGENDQLTVHQWCGYLVLLLVGLRLVWGFVGSRHSRFTDFVRGPTTIWRYLRGGESGPGHNPMGALFVVVVLLVLLIQALTGLFNSDGVLYDGPLRGAVNDDLADQLGAVHDWLFNVILALVALHLLAITYYQFGRRQPLVQAIWRGKALGKEGVSAPVNAGWAVLIVVILAGLLWLAVSLAPEPASYW